MKPMKILAIAACLCASSQMWALDFPWLSFKMKDASVVTVAADKLVMNYSDGKLSLTSGNVNETLSVSDISSMNFSDQPAGIEDVNMVLSEQATYYNLGGIEVGKCSTVDDARRALPSGIYVARTATKTFKVIF